MRQSSEFVKILKKFGIKESYAEKFGFVESKKNIRITSKEYLKEAHLLGAISGIRIFRKGALLNPSSNFVFVFNGKIRKRRIKLSFKELKEFFENGKLWKKTKLRGYVFILYQGKIIALGFSRENEIECFMPKDFRKKALEILKEEHLQK